MFIVWIITLMNKVEVMREQEDGKLIDAKVLAVAIPDTSFDNTRTAIQLVSGEVISVRGLYGEAGDKIKIKYKYIRDK